MAQIKEDCHEYVNSGNGTLHLQATYTMANIQDLVVGDFNHDGYPDIAFSTPGPGGNGDSLHVWFNNHASGFTVGPVGELQVQAARGYPD